MQRANKWRPIAQRVKNVNKKENTIWDMLGTHCSANERRADEASRDVEASSCYFMKNRLGRRIFWHDHWRHAVRFVRAVR